MSARPGIRQGRRREACHRHQKDTSPFYVPLCQMRLLGQNWLGRRHTPHPMLERTSFRRSGDAGRIGVMPFPVEWFVVLGFVAVLVAFGLIPIWIVLCNPAKGPRMPGALIVRGLVVGTTFLAVANYVFADMFLDGT